jgi:diguanylate cyclase (GGDEF)-like protein
MTAPRLNTTTVDRIVLVEDNRAIAKLVSQKIIDATGLQVDIAGSLEKARSLVAENLYSLALLDINLPDAPDGQIVDFMTENGIPSIVLSGMVDKNFRNQMMKKDIIDYIRKGGVEDIQYVVAMIERLMKNRECTVIVVDDSSTFRRQMVRLMENLFINVVSFSSAEEALDGIEGYPEARVLLTDHEMPGISGVELCKLLRKSYSTSELAIIGISASDDDEVSAMFLKNGATDFIRKPFSKEEFSCRINNTLVAMENIQTIMNSANRDYMTGLYNRRYFFETMPAYFQQATLENEAFAVVMVDIDHFKGINDVYGHDVGDQAIIHLAEILRTNTDRYDMVSRFGGEEFCIVLKGSDESVAYDVCERIREAVEHTPLRFGTEEELSFTISLGLKVRPEADLAEMINRADAMLYEAKHGGRNQVCMER